MVSMEQLEKMRYVALDTVDMETLTDMNTVLVQGDTACEKLESYLSQVGNPYYFKVGNTPVRVSFSSDGKSLEEILKRHFLSLKQGTP